MKRAIQEKVWKDTLEEEMRILYVAMTRAKRKLILTGTIKAQDLEAGLRLQINTQKWRATSAMDWLLPILADQFRSTQSEKSEEREGFLKNQETQKQAHSEGVTASWLKARLVNWETGRRIFLSDFYGHGCDSSRCIYGGTIIFL